MGIIGQSIVGVQYLMLGEPTAAALNVIGILMGVVGVVRNRGAQWAKNVYWLFYPAIAANLAINPSSWLAAGGSFLGAASYHQSGLKALRILAVFGGTSWLLYGVTVGSIGQIGFGVFYVGGHIHQLIKMFRPVPSLKT